MKEQRDNGRYTVVANTWRYKSYLRIKKWQKRQEKSQREAQLCYCKLHQSVLDNSSDQLQVLSKLKKLHDSPLGAGGFWCRGPSAEASHDFLWFVSVFLNWTLFALFFILFFHISDNNIHESIALTLLWVRTQILESFSLWLSQASCQAATWAVPPYPAILLYTCSGNLYCSPHPPLYSKYWKPACVVS